MHQHFIPWTRRLAGLALLLLLTACASVPEDREPPPAAGTAEEALAAGDFEAAADAFLEAAQAVEPPRRADYRLRAAGAFVRAERPDRAQEILGATEIDEDTPARSQDLAAAVRGRILLARGRYDSALEATDARLPSETDRAADLLEVTAEAQYRLGRLLDSARSRVALDAELDAGDRRDANRATLRETLAEVPMAKLRERMPPTPDTFGGWLELVFLARNHRLNPERMEAEVAAWRERYPDHPAAGDVADTIVQQYREQVLRPERITLLLPLSGDRAEAGRAVRNGFLAARLSLDHEPAPVVRVRDVGEDGEDPWTAYRQALQAGSDLVVGPLTRDGVAALANRSTLETPVLALNRAPSNQELPGNLFRFGLLPEHEAAQAARYAMATGQSQAVMLTPRNDWGDRVADGFAETFEEGGGTVLARGQYQEDEADFSAPIRQLLDLDDSRERAQRLRRTISRSVEFQPRRRQDVDLVFMGAFPRQARLIRPQLRFHRALDLPVMATSHAWDGREDVAADRDMAGVVFFDMPWMLGAGDARQPRRSQVADVWGDLGQLAPLYALGADAYRLVPYLSTLRSNAEERLEGATGLLRMDSEGVVHREVLPARFQDGEVEQLPDPREQEDLPGLDEAAGGERDGETGSTRELEPAPESLE